MLHKIAGNNTEIINLGQEINVTSVYESEGMEQSNTRISEASEDLDMEEIQNRENDKKLRDRREDIMKLFDEV